jgi:hypothetical protein
MWNAIPYVGTGIALIAFIAAVVAWTYKAQLDKDERLIRAAPESDRGQLVKNALEFFNVETARLSEEQQYKIALEQIQARGQRFKISAAVICFLAIIIAGVTIAIALHGHDQDRSNATEAEAIDPALVGFWEFVAPSNDQGLQLRFQFGANGQFSRQYFMDSAGVVDTASGIMRSNNPSDAELRFRVRDANSLILSMDGNASGIVKQLILQNGDSFEFKRVGVVEDQQNLIVGRWKTSVFFLGVNWECTVEVDHQRKYRSHTEARDEGRIRAASNKYEIVSRWSSTPIQGTYTILSPVKLSLNIFPLDQITLQRVRQ